MIDAETIGGALWLALIAWAIWDYRCRRLADADKSVKSENIKIALSADQRRSRRHEPFRRIS